MEKNLFIWVYLILFAVTGQLATAGNDTESIESRSGKALSVFQVIRFPNKICAGTGSFNGTCYTSSECSSKGGTSSGSCANGFGVCCTFVLTCGGTAAQNCTYFTSSQAAAGSCSVQICMCSTDICQLRLDFSSFVIAGPNTLTATVSKEVNGAVGSGGKEYNLATQCLTDTFSVTGPSGSVPPVICGTNTGEHMYVDSSDSCNALTFNMGQSGIGTGIPTRSWSIKITQISCYDSYSLAPSGCTQYFAGTSGMFQSYNYANLFQLANQKQRTCFRRERGYCRVCFSAIATDFAVSGSKASGFISQSMCCGYGPDGMGTGVGYDCVFIPGASKATLPVNVLAPNAYCGKSAGLVSVKGDATKNKTICTSQTPFNFNFYTDAWSFAKAGTKGFKLTYFQTTC